MKNICPSCQQEIGEGSSYPCNCCGSEVHFECKTYIPSEDTFRRLASQAGQNSSASKKQYTLETTLVCFSCIRNNAVLDAYYIGYLYGSRAGSNDAGNSSSSWVNYSCKGCGQSVNTIKTAKVSPGQFVESIGGKFVPIELKRFDILSVASCLCETCSRNIPSVLAFKEGLIKGYDDGFDSEFDDADYYNRLGSNDWD